MKMRGTGGLATVPFMAGGIFNKIHYMAGGIFNKIHYTAAGIFNKIHYMVGSLRMIRCSSLLVAGL